MSLSEDLAKINKEIDSIRKELGKKPLQPFKLEDLEKAKESLAGLSAELREMSSDLDYISKSFKDSVNELSKQNTYLSDAKSSLRGISSISEKILQYRKGETSLSEKELQNLQQQAKAKFTSLQNSIKSGQLGKENTKEAQKALDAQILFDKELDRTIELNKQVNKEIGLLGTGIGGVSKLLSNMGFGDLSKPLQDAIDKTKNARLQQKLNNDELKKLKEEYDNRNKSDLENAKSLRDQMASLKSQNKELDGQTSKYKNIGNALKDQLTSYNAIDAIIMGLIDGFNQSQKGIGDMAKGLGMSATRSADMRHEFANIANLSMNANLTVKDLQESQIAVGQALGSNAMLNEADLETMTDIVKKTGLQHSELIGIEKLSLATGTSLEDNVENALGGATAFAKQNKMVIDNNKVLREVNKASSSLKLSLGGSVKELGKAVVQAQKFGLNLEQAEKMSSSLLDFEQSIENELSAELLTGKNLNLERARGLALNGDVAGAAAEIASQVGSAADFGKMNVIQQEAIAKAIGLGRDELAASLIEKESLAALNAEEGETALQAYENLKKQGLTQDEIIAKVGEKAAADLEQQSAQEKFNNSVGKLKEIFTQVMDALAPIFSTLSDIVAIVLPAMNYLLTPIINTFRGISDIITSIMDPTKSLGETLADMGPVTAGIALALTAAGVAVVGSLVPGLIRAGIAALSSLPGLMSVAIAAVTSASAATLGIGAIAIAAGIAGVIASIVSAKSKAVNDGIFPAAGGSGYGKRVLTGPEGSIQLNNKDTVIAGTNLFGDDIKSSPNKPTEMGGKDEIKVKSEGGDMTSVISAIKELASRPINVTVQMDSVKVIEALGEFPNTKGETDSKYAFKVGSGTKV
jgi:hypothetical protein